MQIKFNQDVLCTKTSMGDYNSSLVNYKCDLETNTIFKAGHSYPASLAKKDEHVPIIHIFIIMLAIPKASLLVFLINFLGKYIIRHKRV